MNTKGTHRVSDGLPVDFLDARAAWARAARPILQRVARHYNATITYQELADESQDRAGIRTDMPMRHWIGKMLYAVAKDDYKRTEPLLTALCVHADGTIGDGFADAIRNTYGEIVTEPLIEERAARERFACYKYFGAVMPADGGRPTLTKEVAAKRERARRRKEPQPQLVACPTCHLVLPMSGRCDNCSPRS